MKSSQRKLKKLTHKHFAFLLIVISAGFIFFAPPLEEDTAFEQAIRIGVSDDMSGFVIDFIIEEKLLLPDEEIKPFFIRDC